MGHGFIVYIDESGCDGLLKFKSKGIQGSSHWFAQSCLIVDVNADSDLVRLRDKIIKETSRGSVQRQHLHFVKLNHDQRLTTSRIIGESLARQWRCSTVFSKKLGMSPATIAMYQQRPIAGRPESGKSLYYWYVARHLIERISWCCDESKSAEKSAKLVFSRRKHTDVNLFKAYLAKLKAQGTSATTIRWNVIDIDAVEVAYYKQYAGLQLVDATASSFARAVEIDHRSGEREKAYAHNLRPITYSRNGNYRSYGMKCLLDKGQQLTSEEQTFFDGYK